MGDVYIPHGGGGGRRPLSDETGEHRVGGVEHFSCGVAGLAAAVTVVVLTYPLLLAVARPLHLLSTTAIVFVFVGLWLATWAAFEVAWEWNAGRLSGE